MKMPKFITRESICILILCGTILSVQGQQIIEFHPSKDVTLTLYKPEREKSNGIAILVIPGGGYGGLATETEGTPIAEALTKRGITSFVLKYRMPIQTPGTSKSLTPLKDGQAAIKFIRDRAREWNINPRKIGVMGFSAGGHLAATLETKYDKSYIENPSRTSLRPDFGILIYAVISMDEQVTHLGSRENLIGPNASRDSIDFFSIERQITKDTPPTYITHTADDGVVDVRNSILMYESLVKQKVPAELHLFPEGDHGFVQRLPDSEWLDPICLFLKKQGFHTTNEL